MDYPIKPVRGNWFKLAQPLEKIVWLNSQHTIEDYVPAEGDNLKVALVGAYDHYEMEKVQIELNPENNKLNLLTYENNGTLPLGLYDIEISVTLADGKRLHSCQPKRVKVVKTNSEASIPDSVEFGVDTYELDGAVFMYVPSEGGSGDMSNYYTKDEADARYLQDESDPTVPAWAKQPTKPTYTAQEVGALPANTPIPSEVTESTVSGWGFTKNTGTYSIPSGGIPKTDLSQDVQQVLDNIPSGGGGDVNVIEKVKVNHVELSIDSSDKSVDITSVPASIVTGDSTHRFVTDTEKSTWDGKTSNIGTITGITMNGSSMGTSGNVDLGTVLTAQQQVDWNAQSGVTSIANKPTIPDFSGKEDKVTVAAAQTTGFTASVGNYYKVTNSGSITITLTTPSDTAKISSCIFLIDNTSGNDVTFQATSGSVYYSKGWDISPNKVYEVNALFNGTAWYLTQVEMEVQS